MQEPVWDAERIEWRGGSTFVARVGGSRLYVVRHSSSPGDRWFMRIDGELQLEPLQLEALEIDKAKVEAVERVRQLVARLVEAWG